MRASMRLREVQYLMDEQSAQRSISQFFHTCFEKVIFGTLPVPSSLHAFFSGPPPNFRVHLFPGLTNKATFSAPWFMTTTINTRTPFAEGSLLGTRLTLCLAYLCSKTHLVQEVLDVVGRKFLLRIYYAMKIRLHEVGHDVHVFELLW